MESEDVTAADGHRERIVAAAARLLAEGGPDAVSTRAVSAAAGVQPPAIYRLFGDKEGLLDAVVADGFTVYLTSKTARKPTDDPVEDLRAGWDLHVGLGLANPALYTLMYGRYRPGTPSPAALAAFEVLAAHIRRIAEAGRLRVPEDRAADLVHAAGCGTTLTLIATPESRRDPELSRTAREAVIAAIATDAPVAPAPGPVAAAVTLRAVLPRTDALTAPERGLMEEWLNRIADPG
ncbi:TetR/AcrR family transcriptional regulator [Streptomyces mirabilis]|uniref:TetR/AcrR family transcriptional regulator n=1 Tax=Streptomyces mirabilis TaxID=68239 RepID=UPI0021C06865|nr:TetR/AcrR family transcriptional regulator [Streptomyces mirabilis]MCT9105044.1 TetR/AcrR family transcriptional regulator [Streptomyces mirabilis]